MSICCSETDAFSLPKNYISRIGGSQEAKKSCFARLETTAHSKFHPFAPRQNSFKIQKECEKIATFQQLEEF